MVTNIDSNHYMRSISAAKEFGVSMSEGYREVVSKVAGATLSRDECARRLRDEIKDKDIEKIFRYPLNGIPAIKIKSAHRPS